jgi:hypothetical protein
MRSFCDVSLLVQQLLATDIKPFGISAKHSMSASGIPANNLISHVRAIEFVVIV